MAERSKVRVCERLLAGIAGSNPVGGMDVCLLCLLCVLLGRGPSNGAIPCPEESHRLCCDWDEENLT